MFDPREFAITKAKPLPLYLMLDTSGSMGGPKIEELNNAVNELINSLANEEKSEVEILISIITFGGSVQLHTPPTPASDINFEYFSASGVTPMGGALSKAKKLIEDRGVTPSRAYRPTIILMSDGLPTDSWEAPLNSFINDGRSQKCDRMAMSIGGEGEEVLREFIKNTENDLFNASDAKDIHEFFRYVTMSVTARSKSQNPNLIPNREELEQGNVVTLDVDESENANQTDGVSTSGKDNEPMW